MSVRTPSPVERRREFLRSPVGRNPVEDALSRVIGSVKTMSFLVSARNAIPDNVVDSFEERQYEDKNNTLTDYYGGDTGNVSRKNVTDIDGDYVIEWTSSGGNISSTSGLNTYPSQGDTFRFVLKTGSSLDDQVSAWYATQQEDSNPGGYKVALNETNTELRLFEISTGGSANQIASTSVSINASTWYDIEVGWTTGDNHNIDVFEYGTSTSVTSSAISVTDSTHTSGGIGWAASNVHQADYYRIV